jgi:DNA-binding XRE family transcriptional regulator
MTKKSKPENFPEVPIEKMTVSQRIGYNIYCARELHQLTRAQLAKLMDITRQSIQQHEKGEIIRMNYQFIISLCNILNIDLDYLFSGTPMTNLKMSRKDLISSQDRQVVQLIKAFNRIKSKKDKENLIRFVKGVAGKDKISTGKLYTILKEDT